MSDSQYSQYLTIILVFVLVFVVCFIFFYVFILVSSWSARRHSVRQLASSVEIVIVLNPANHLFRAVGHIKSLGRYLSWLDPLRTGVFESRSGSNHMCEERALITQIIK